MAKNNKILTCCLQGIDFKYKDIYKLSEEIEKDIPCQQKQK